MEDGSIGRLASGVVPFGAGPVVGDWAGNASTDWPAAGVPNAAAIDAQSPIGMSMPPGIIAIARG